MSYSENKKAYNMKYKERTYKRVPLDLRFEDYGRIKEHAEQMNETVNGFIKRAISETMLNDIKPHKD